MSVTIKVLFFAKAKDIALTSESKLTLSPKQTFESLITVITTKYNLEQIQNSITIALNSNFCIPGDEILLKNGDEIAIIPPLSGG